MTRYRYGGGTRGNAAAFTIDVLRSPLPYIERVTNRFPARGGLDAESLDDLKLRAPSHLRTLHRAVTPSDFEYLALQAVPGLIGRVLCLQSADTPAEIQVVVIPQLAAHQQLSPQALSVEDDTLQRVRDYLDERRLLSTVLTVQVADYHWIETEIGLQIEPRFSSDIVRKSVEERLAVVVHPLTGGYDGQGWPFGRNLSVEEVTGLVNLVPGVAKVHYVRLYPVTFETRQPERGESVSILDLPPNGVFVSYRHQIRIE
jgi:predicted phage baseplate assembly protein